MSSYIHLSESNSKLIYILGGSAAARIEVSSDTISQGFQLCKRHMAEATKALNQKLEVPQGAEFNPECSGSDKTMAVTASIEAAAVTALSSSSSNGLNGIRTWYPRNNKGLGSKFQSSRVRDKPEEGRRIRRPKRCEKNNLDEEVSPKISLKIQSNS